MNKDPPMGAKGAVSVEKVHGFGPYHWGTKRKTSSQSRFQFQAVSRSHLDI